MSAPETESPSLKIQPIDSSRVEALLNSCFQVGEGDSFFDDFPSWTSNRALWLGAFSEDGHLCAAAGALPGQWMLGADGASITIVRIGGVVTDSRHRGQGLASRLVGLLVEHARGAGAQACVLWGQDSPLYRRLGFLPLGRQMRAPLAGLVSLADRSPAFLRIEEGFSGEVFRAMSESRMRSGGVLLSAGEADEMVLHRHTRWARVLDGQDRLVGYGAFGKGIDLGFQLHEWGGTPEAIRMIGRWALSIHPGAEIMGTPHQLESVFGALPGESVVEPLCLALGFDPSTRELLAARELELWFWGVDGV